LAAEAVVFFDPARGANMSERRKRGGHLISKHRFVAAQIEAYVADDLWLKLARHANAMADRLAGGLAAAGLHPVWPVEANEVFVALPSSIDERLKAAGASYYPWTTDALPNGVMPAPDTTLVRLVTSFATTAAEVDRFVATTRAS
jgi:threonine aldolase